MHAKAIDDCAASWTLVPSPDGLRTAAYIEASFATTTIFNLLGSIVSSVSKDIQSNANKLKKAAGDSKGTLENVIQAEITAAGGDAKKAAKEGSAALALLWLARYLRLVDVMLTAMLRDPERPLRDCIYEGYEAALKPHHPFLTRKALGAAILAAPNRQFFYTKLESDADGCLESIRDMQGVFAPLMRQTHEYLARLGLEDAPKADAAKGVAGAAA